jgi:hypothetical protein
MCAIRCPWLRVRYGSQLTLEEWLRRLDDLLERGVITEEKHARQRARIQDESL